MVLTIFLAHFLSFSGLFMNSKKYLSNGSFQKLFRFTKNSKADVTNYRQIANLCSTSKIFERLILNRILDIEIENNIDITGKQQHGFKKGWSTSTASLVLQSLISRALDDQLCIDGKFRFECCIRHCKC